MDKVGKYKLQGNIFTFLKEQTKRDPPSPNRSTFDGLELKICLEHTHRTICRGTESKVLLFRCTEELSSLLFPHIRHSSIGFDSSVCSITQSFFVNLSQFGTHRNLAITATVQLQFHLILLWKTCEWSYSNARRTKATYCFIGVASSSVKTTGYEWSKFSPDSHPICIEPYLIGLVKRTLTIEPRYGLRCIKEAKAQLHGQQSPLSRPSTSKCRWVTHPTRWK